MLDLDYGSYSVICGDCITELKKFPDSIFDLAICDPPYGGVLSAQWDKVSDYAKWTEEWIIEVLRVLKTDASIYVWCSVGEKSSSLIDIVAVLRKQAVFRDMIVWNKQRGRGNRRGWLFTREECVWATKSDQYRWNKEHQYSTEKYHESWIKRLGKEDNPYKRATNVWSDIEEPTIEEARKSGGRGKRVVLHPAQKPLGALSRIILPHTAPGDLVLDPFLGSGSTAIASLELGRRCVGIEKELSYCELALNRINEWKMGSNPFILKARQNAL
jgi:DNA modification methylase